MNIWKVGESKRQRLRPIVRLTLRKVIHLLADTSKPFFVLVVDDDPGNRHVAGSILNTAGYHVLTCTSGRDAIERCLVQAQLPDLILINLQMPVLGGDETAWFLRNADATAGIPIIGLTEDAKRLADPDISTLFDHLLTMPCKSKALLRTLDKALVPASSAKTC